MSKAIEKYLRDHAEELAKLDWSNLLPNHSFGHALVIPVHAEGRTIIQTLSSISNAAHPHLIILVLNARETDNDSIHTFNQESYDAICEHYSKAQKIAKNMSLHQHPRGTLLLVDHYSKEQRFKPKEGVGLARKIGSDIALSIWRSGLLLCPYINSSDADVLFPEDYFQQILDTSPKERHSAILYSFWHTPTPDTPRLRRATALYEIKLRYYVLGLKYAQSPYAFHTVGSTLAIHANDYASVRGFPKRLAGEDFYILNKLNKIRPIKKSRGEALVIQGRHSNRVPFGTGKGIEEIEQKQDEECLFYSPEIFTKLRALQVALEKAAISATPNTETLLESLDHQTQESLAHLDLWHGIIDALQRGKDSKQRRENLHTYFDGFRTLKFIHVMRDSFFPSLPFRKALKEAPFVTHFDFDNLEKLRIAMIKMELDLE